MHSVLAALSTTSPHECMLATRAEEGIKHQESDRNTMKTATVVEMDGSNGIYAHNLV